MWRRLFSQQRRTFCLSRPPPPPPPGGGKRGRTPPNDIFDETKYNLVDLLKFSCTLYCLHEYVIDITALAGPSMLPTFNETGDIVMVNCLFTKMRRQLQRGDIVIAKSPTNPQNTVCKRVLALEGEEVVIQPQYWYQEESVITIPRGQVWLEGDNPFNSTDSRTYGPVSLNLIRGVVFFKLFPFKEFGWIERAFRRPGVLYPRLDFRDVRR